MQNSQLKTHNIRHPRQEDTIRPFESNRSITILKTDDHEYFFNKIDKRHIFSISPDCGVPCPKSRIHSNSPSYFKLSKEKSENVIYWYVTCKENPSQIQFYFIATGGLWNRLSIVFLQTNKHNPFKITFELKSEDEIINFECHFQSKGRTNQNNSMINTSLKRKFNANPEPLTKSQKTENATIPRILPFAIPPAPPLYLFPRPRPISYLDAMYTFNHLTLVNMIARLNTQHNK